MSENVNEIRTVQNYRHAARRSLKSAQESLALRTDATREVYVLVNGMIETVILGKPGYTQEEQVQRLSEARDILTGNIEALPAKVAEARASVEAQMDAWETDILAKAQEAVDTLSEAATFAAERDFAAWQEQKGRGVTPTADASDYEDEPEDDDEED